MKRVSVIIPVYNAERYIRTCLDSIVQQSIGMENIEIIIVDDGSQDATSAIINEYCNQYGSIKVINLPDNTGNPGHCRNIGITRASGEYLFFVDADDWIGLEALKKLYNHAKEWKSDTVQGRMISVNFAKQRGITKYFSGRKASIPRGDLLQDGVLTSSLSPMRLVKRDLVVENNILFPEDVWYEDIVFSLRVLFASQVISIANDYDYYYVRRDADNNSISNLLTRRITINSPRTLIRGVKRIFETIEEYGKPNVQYLKLLKKIFTHPVRETFELLDCLPDLGDIERAKMQKELWEQVSIYYQEPLIEILPIREALMFDCFKQGLFSIKQMDILRFCEPRLVNKTCILQPREEEPEGMQKWEGDTSPFGKELMHRLTLLQARAAVIKVDSFYLDSDEMLLMRGHYFFPFCMAERRGFRIEGYDFQKNLVFEAKPKVESEPWGEPFQEKGKWEFSVRIKKEQASLYREPFQVYAVFVSDTEACIKIAVENQDCEQD